MAKKYKYSNWLNGEVVLDCSSRYFNERDIKSPVIVNLKDFSQADAEKIKKLQELIFNESVKELLEKLKNNFIQQYSDSEMREDLINGEINQCEDIMFGEIPDSELLYFEFWNVPFENQYLQELRLFLKDNIKRGVRYNYCQVHSPNSPYSFKGKYIPQVSAHALWNYYKWLKTDFSLPANLEVSENFENSLFGYNKRAKIVKKDNVHTLWFEVGLLFADGRMDQLLLKFKEEGSMANYSAIARELGNKSYRPYISESVNNSNSTDKNIFSKKEKYELIIEHCNYNNITVVESFRKRIEKARDIK
jgi:hypothetical protein